MPTPQVPIGSGFGPATTASDVIRGSDLTSKVAIVTGGYTGIGLETTRAFLRGGAKVIVPARDHAKATNALITWENARTPRTRKSSVTADRGCRGSHTDDVILAGAKG